MFAKKLQMDRTVKMELQILVGKEKISVWSPTNTNLTVYSLQRELHDFIGTWIAMSKYSAQ